MCSGLSAEVLAQDDFESRKSFGENDRSESGLKIPSQPHSDILSGQHFFTVQVIVVFKYH